MVRRFLVQLGLVSFLRTTGGKGLHVVVPLNPGADWASAKAFAHGFAEHPRAAASAGVRGNRRQALPAQGKIYLDYLRNSRGATA